MRNTEPLKKGTLVTSLFRGVFGGNIVWQSQVSFIERCAIVIGSFF